MLIRLRSADILRKAGKTLILAYGRNKQNSMSAVTMGNIYCCQTQNQKMELFCDFPKFTVQLELSCIILVNICFIRLKGFDSSINYKQKTGQCPLLSLLSEHKIFPCREVKVSLKIFSQ